MFFDFPYLGLRVPCLGNFSEGFKGHPSYMSRVVTVQYEYMIHIVIYLHMFYIRKRIYFTLS